MWLESRRRAEKDCVVRCRGVGLVLDTPNVSIVAGKSQEMCDSNETGVHSTFCGGDADFWQLRAGLGHGWGGGVDRRRSLSLARETARPQQMSLAPVDPHVDLELVRRAMERMPAALDELGRRLRCVPAFVHTLNRRSRDPLSTVEIEDLAQDIVIAVINGLDRYRGDSRLEAWIWPICRHRLLNRRRDLQRAVPVVGLSTIAEEPQAPGENVTEQVSRATRLLSTLPAAQSMIVERRHARDQTFASIGRELGMPQDTVKSRYYKAIRTLRARWSQPTPRP